MVKLELIKHQSCMGCAAVTSNTNCMNCVLGFKVKKKRVGYGMDSRLLRTPVHPCYKPETRNQLIAVGEHMGIE